MSRSGAERHAAAAHLPLGSGDILAEPTAQPVLPEALLGQVRRDLEVRGDRGEDAVASAGKGRQEPAVRSTSQPVPASGSLARFRRSACRSSRGPVRGPCASLGAKLREGQSPGRKERGPIAEEIDATLLKVWHQFISRSAAGRSGARPGARLPGLRLGWRCRAHPRRGPPTRERSPRSAHTTGLRSQRQVLPRRTTADVPASASGPPCPCDDCRGRRGSAANVHTSRDTPRQVCHGFVSPRR